MGQEDNAKRILTAVLWVLVMVLPGGLPLMALWMAFKAARRGREGKAAQHQHQHGREVQQPAWAPSKAMASKATESQIQAVAASCAGCTAQA